jgi:membrane protease YdiL (CAAX protease family)
MLVLNANETGTYHLIGMVMLLSALVPFFFLSRSGRKKIGLKSPKTLQSLVFAFATGIVFSVLLYLIGKELYDTSYENWYAYIGKSYQIPEAISVDDRRTMFMVMATMGMIFSPIGEELFFRGIVHGSFAKSIGDKRASIVDSSAFALTHLSHFGLVFIDDDWTFYPLPGLLWVLSMFLLSLLFFEMKKRADSVWGPVICHSAFNLGMIYCIFYLM